MTLKLSLPPETEAKMRQLAAASGQNLEDIVLQAITEKLAEVESSRPTSLNHDEWKKKLQEFIDLHPVVTHFVDDSRESIYAGRGE